MWAGFRKRVGAHDTLPFRFNYQPLKDDEIRLLWLLPRSKDGQLQGILQHFSWNQMEPYRCLSYTWGSPNKCRTMTLDGANFPITLNLAEALNTISSSLEMGDHEPIWIDAICINQEDNEEKTRQVQKMSFVYSRASMVLGWLGPASKDSDVAVDFIYNFHREMLEADDEHGPHQTKSFQALLQSRFFNDNATAKPEWTAIKAFFLRNFWTRVWIIQEVNLATNFTFLCGHRTIDSETMRLVFMALVLLFGASRPIEATYPGKLLQKMPTSPGFTLGFWGGESKSNLKTGLKIMCISMGKISPTRKRLDTHAASDSRDYVYGLSGIVTQDCADLGIQTNYHLSSQQLYGQLARAFLEKRGDLDILSYCQFPRVTESLPTWVPDWAMCMHPPIEARTEENQFRVSGETTASVSFTDGPLILNIQGIKIGQVTAIGPNWMEREHIWQWSPKEPTLFEILDHLKHLININPESSAYSTPESQEDALWRTAILDCEAINMDHMQMGLKDSQSGVHRRASKLMYECFESVMRIKKLLETGNSALVSADDLQRFRAYYSETEVGIFFRRFFSVEGKYVGVGPFQLKIGDTVVIFSGCAVPFILRPKAGNFELIGEAYIHGIMYGEFVDFQVCSFETFQLV